MRIYDPVEVLFSFIGTIGTSKDMTEESWAPLHALIRAFSRLHSLAIFDLALLVRGQLVIPFNEGFDGRVPQSLRLPFALLFDGSGHGRRMLRVRGIEKELLVMSLESSQIMFPPQAYA